MTFVTGDEVRRQAKDLVMAYMAHDVGADGVTQAEIFKKCGFSWGVSPNASEAQQQFWIAALMQVLSADGLVERISEHGPWRCTRRGQEMYATADRVVINDGRVVKLRALTKACIITTMGMNANCGVGACGARQQTISIDSRLCWDSKPHATMAQQSFWVIGAIGYLQRKGIVAQGIQTTLWRLAD